MVAYYSGPRVAVLLGWALARLVCVFSHYLFCPLMSNYFCSRLKCLGPNTSSGGSRLGDGDVLAVPFSPAPWGSFPKRRTVRARHVPVPSRYLISRSISFWGSQQANAHVVADNPEATKMDIHGRQGNNTLFFATWPLLLTAIFKCLTLPRKSSQQLRPRISGRPNDRSNRQLSSSNTIPIAQNSQ